MLRYSASIPTVAPAATADLAITALWNPSTDDCLYVHQIFLMKTAAGGADIPRLRRITTEGTTVVTFTPGIQHEWSRQIAPPSGARLIGDWSAEPTLEGTAGRGIVSAVIPGTAGSGMIWVFRRPIKIPAGMGLALVTGSALAFPISQATWVWEE